MLFCLTNSLVKSQFNKRFIKELHIAKVIFFPFLPSQVSHLISFHLGDQVLEGGETAENDHGLTLLRGQALHLGHRCTLQHHLRTTQEVLELRVVGRLAEGNRKWLSMTCRGNATLSTLVYLLECILNTLW